MASGIAWCPVEARTQAPVCRWVKGLDPAANWVNPLGSNPMVNPTLASDLR